VVKIIKIVNAEPGFPEEYAVAMKMLLQPFLQDRAEFLVPQRFSEVMESIKATLMGYAASTWRQ
jgi:hypothetical protein